jgi:hypothetical protein
VRRPKISNTVDLTAPAGERTTVSILAVLIVVTIQADLLLALVLLGIAAHRQHELANIHHGRAVPITDEVDVVAHYAETATEAADRALEEADQAQHAALQAAAARDIAEQRHRLTLKQAEAAGGAHRLLQRAALDAYQRRQLSAAQLNRIWQHTQAMTEPAPRPAVVPLGWELRVREAHRRCEQAEAEAARAAEDASRKAATAATLAERAQAVESLLSVERRSASTGLVGLLRTGVPATAGRRDDRRGPAGRPGRGADQGAVIAGPSAGSRLFPVRRSGKEGGARAITPVLRR